MVRGRKCQSTAVSPECGKVRRMVFVDTKIVSTRGWFPLAPAVLTNDGVAFRLRGELGCQGIDPFRGSHERQGKPVSLSSDRE